MENGAQNYRRYLAGDDRGIAGIVAEYKDGLILFLNSFVNDIHTAEDLAEDTFFQLMVKKPAFSGKSSFKTWLYAIGRNAARNEIRRRARRREAPAAENEPASRDAYDLERAYIREEQRLALHRAAAKLPPEYRQILWLVYFEGLSNREAELVLKKNARQIANLLYHAKQALKTELGKENFEYEKF